MKYSRTAIILTTLCSIILFTLGIVTFSQVFELILPKVEGGFYQVLEVNESFKTAILFSVPLGLTPVLIYLTWLYSPIISRQKRLSSILIVITCITLAIIVRHQMIRSYFTGLLNTSTSSIEKINVNYPMSEVHLEYYLFAGLSIGCIISYYLLRHKKI